MIRFLPPMLALGLCSAVALAQTSPFSATPTVFPASGSNGANTVTVSVHVVSPSSISSFGVPLGFLGNPEFQVLGQTGCTVDGTTVMVAGATCFVAVRFTPLGPGIRTGTLLVTDGAGKTTAFGLAGTGYYPQIAITPAAAAIVAGLGPSSAGYTGDGDAAALASISNPQGVATDSFGNVYVADTGNNVVRMLDAFGNLTTVAGGGSVAGAAADGGAATSAILAQPRWLAIDSAGNLYISETGNHVVRRVAMSSNGTITTVAGSYTVGFSDGASAITAKLNSPQGIAVDPNGNLYIVDAGNERIRFVNAASGIISTFAGSGDVGFDPSPVAALNAHFNAPSGITLDSSGQVFFGDSGNHVVRKIAGGSVSVVAGTGTSGRTGDGGAATAATLVTPNGVALTPGGDLYIADTGSGTVRKVEAGSGNIETIAGTGKAGSYTAGVSVATSTGMNGPLGLAFDSRGDLYLSDSGNNVVRLVATAPGELDFAAQAVGNTSAGATVEVANIGNATMAISSVAATNSSTASNYVLTNTGAVPCASSLAMGTHCVFTVAFAPKASGFTPGEIDVTDNVGPAVSNVHPVYLLGGLRVPLTIGPVTLPAVVSGHSYNQTITATGGFGTITIDAAGTLPAGISSSVSGTTVTLGGTPAGAGTFSFTAYASDTLGETTAQSYSIVVLPQTVSLSLSEPVHVFDNPSGLPFLSLNLGEAVHITDSIFHSTNLLLNIAEPIHVTDSVVNTEGLILVVNETVQTTDSLQKLPGLLLTLSEGIGVTDRSNPLSGLILTVPESVGVRDTPQQRAGLVLAVNEALTVADKVLNTMVTAAPPTANGQSIAVRYNTPAAITLTANSPNSGRTLSYTVATNPAHGALSGSAPSLTYTPANGYIGTDSFTFYANDGAGGGNSGTATVSITVSAIQAPTISESFNVSPVAPAARSVVTFTLGNPAANTVTLTGVSFTETLPVNLAVYSTPGVSTTCGSGTVTAAAGSRIISLSGATIAPGASCTVSVNVSSSVPGAYTSTTGAVTADNASFLGGTASATLIVSNARGVTIISPTIHLSQPLNGGPNAYITAYFDFTGTQAPTGAVTMLVNGSSSGISGLVCTPKPLHTSCTASYSASGVNPGSYILTVSQAADTFYSAVSGVGFVTVAP